jgi:uncharacterized protein (TIGR00299 family) protein
VLYLDLVGGAAGDMILAALVDAGAPLEPVREAIATLGLKDISIVEREAHPAGLRARQIDVIIGGKLADAEVITEAGHAHDHRDTHDHHHDHAHEHAHRPYRAVRRLIRDSSLPDGAKEIALDAFYQLAEAEALAHGVDVEEVVFHEVGADDAITDVVGVAIAVESLAIDEIVVSPVPIARGLTRGAHGPVPLPGPAAMHILTGAPLVETSLQGETVTPTGAALLAALADRFGPMPSMTLEHVGVGAGHKVWPDRPNIVRAMIGQKVDPISSSADDAVIEANIDDMNPEHYGALERALFDAGALDVWSQPIRMKKGRLGVQVSVLARRTITASIARTFFDHSTTLGVRIREVERMRIERRMESVNTRFGPVRVKVAVRPSGPQVVPEHEDCERLAREANVPIRLVYEAALEAAWT